MADELGRGRLDGRESAAVRRLVDRVAQVYQVGSTLEDGAPVAAREGPGGAKTDLVLSVEAPAGAADWRGHIQALAGCAAKVLIVVVRNPEQVGSPHPRDGCDTLGLARVLWELGRVREHSYLVFPRVVEIVAALRGRLVAPDVALAPVDALVRRTARLHAFVLDTAPRTRQARRRLRIQDASGGSA